jgi:hypothetical protein
MGTQNKKQITQLLNQYYKLLKSQGEVTFSIYDDQYHLSLFQCETEILSLIGLPNRIQNHHSLYEMAMKAVKDNSDATDIVEKMKLLSEKQQQNIDSENSNSIFSGSKNRHNPFEILPDLAGNVNGYSLFLYNKMLFKEGLLNEQVLDELKLLKKLDCVGDIYLLCFDCDYKHNKIYQELGKLGLKYLSAYLKWYHSRIK